MQKIFIVKLGMIHNSLKLIKLGKNSNLTYAQYIQINVKTDPPSILTGLIFRYYLT